jgi:hypothetical protein
MGWFDDERLEDIYNHGDTYGVSPEDCFLIRRKLVILKAIASGATLGVVGTIFSFPGGRRGVRVTPDWSISFTWFEGVGAFAMRLEP